VPSAPSLAAPAPAALVSFSGPIAPEMLLGRELARAGA
jgi:hypothetical protein